MNYEKHLTISSRQTVTYDGLTVISEQPLAGSEMVRRLQNLVVELVNAQLGEVEAKKEAARQGEAAADEVEGRNTLQREARALGLRDRREAPLRKVTWSRTNSRKNKLECGHDFQVPAGHERKSKYRRCVECLKAEVAD